MDTILEEIERLRNALDGLTMKAEERAILENRYERGVMQQLIEDILDNKVMQHDAAIEAIEYLQAEVERLRDQVRRLQGEAAPLDKEQALKEMTQLSSYVDEVVAENKRLQKCERHEYERANKAEARVAELTRDRDAARAAFNESDIACAELEARVDELERLEAALAISKGKHENCIKDNERLQAERDYYKTRQTNSAAYIVELEARVAELQQAGKRLLDATTEGPWDRYAKVPRGYIRELEKALFQESAND